MGELLKIGDRTIAEYNTILALRPRNIKTRSAHEQLPPVLTQGVRHSFIKRGQLPRVYDSSPIDLVSTNDKSSPIARVRILEYTNAPDEKYMGKIETRGVYLIEEVLKP